MPYRHELTIESVGIVLSRIEEMKGLRAEEGALIGRFTRASARRLQDEERRTGGGGSAKSEEKEREGANGGTGIRGSGPSFADEDILECAPFDAEMCSAADHQVTRAIVKVLAERGIHTSV